MNEMLIKILNSVGFTEVTKNGTKDVYSGVRKGQRYTDITLANTKPDFGNSDKYQEVIITYSYSI